MSRFQVDRFKPCPTPTNKDNMLAFSTGEEEVFLEICNARVKKLHLRDEDKRHMDLNVLFISSDWDKVALEMPKTHGVLRRTSIHMQTYYRQNKDDITTYLKEQARRRASLPTQPSNSMSSSWAKKRRSSDSDADVYGTAPPKKRQTTESTSPKSHSTNQPVSPPSMALDHSGNEGSTKSETSTSGSTSPSSRCTGNNSSQQPSTGDSTPQSKHSVNGESPECSVEVTSEEVAAMKEKYEGQIALLKLQLGRQKDRYEEKLTAKDDQIQILKKENDQLRRANCNLELDRNNLKDKVDQHKKGYKEMKAELTEKADKRAALLEVEIDRSARLFRQLDGRFSDKRMEWDEATIRHDREKRVLERQLHELRKVDARHKAERDQLRERAGLDGLGKPVPKHPLATYGPAHDALHSQNSVNHACEKYFIQMLLNHYDTRREKQQKFLKTVTTIFKNHNVPLPAYLGGESTETKKSGA